MPDVLPIDPYSPKEIAERVENNGVTKARLPLLSQVVLGILGGGFIGLGALYYTILTCDPTLSFPVTRLLGGLAFSLGLILVVVGGGELFTGNHLLVMAWTGKRITTRELLGNWTIIWLTNFVGAAGLAALVLLSNHMAMNGGGLGAHAVKIAALKTSLPFMEAFAKGILCNVLVCLAVWLGMAGRSVADKILAIVFPVSAFVAAGFEHSVANMYFITLGLLLKATGFAVPATIHTESLTWAGMIRNLVPVTLGNIVGGGVMVALIYYLVYRRGIDRTPATEPSMPETVPTGVIG